MWLCHNRYAFTNNNEELLGGRDPAAGTIGSQNVYYAVNSKKAEIILMIQVTLNENQGNERLKVIK